MNQLEKRATTIAANITILDVQSKAQQFLRERIKDRMLQYYMIIDSESILERVLLDLKADFTKEGMAYSFVRNKLLEKGRKLLEDEAWEQATKEMVTSTCG